MRLVTLPRVVVLRSKVVMTSQGSSSLWAANSSFSPNERRSTRDEAAAVVSSVRVSRSRAGHVCFSRGPIARKKASL
jgi:hypothetical protein